MLVSTSHMYGDSPTLGAPAVWSLHSEPRLGSGPSSPIFSVIVNSCSSDWIRSECDSEKLHLQALKDGGGQINKEPERGGGERGEALWALLAS